MLSGLLLGFMLRSKPLGFIQKAITLLIWVLLFLLGVEVGGNERIVKGMSTLGLEAAVLTLFGVAGSSLLAWALWLFISKRKDTKDER